MAIDMTYLTCDAQLFVVRNYTGNTRQWWY